MRHRTIKVKVFSRKRRRNRGRVRHNRPRARSRRRITHRRRKNAVRMNRARRNPMRYNRKHRSHKRRRHNPVRLGNLLSISRLVQFLSMGLGFLVGNQVNNFLSTGAFFFYAPASKPAWTNTLAPARPFFGLAQILLGGFLTVKLRNPMLKNVASGIAVAGGVDLVGNVIHLISPSASTAGMGMDVSPGGTPAMLGTDNYLPSFGMDAPRNLFGMDVDNVFENA